MAGAAALTAGAVSAAPGGGASGTADVWPWALGGLASAGRTRSTTIFLPLRKCRRRALSGNPSMTLVSRWPTSICVSSASAGRFVFNRSGSIRPGRPKVSTARLSFCSSRYSTTLGHSKTMRWKPVCSAPRVVTSARGVCAVVGGPDASRFGVVLDVGGSIRSTTTERPTRNARALTGRVSAKVRVRRSSLRSTSRR